MIRKFLTEHVVLKLLSLGMAVALWMAVGSDPVTEATFRVPLEFLNVPAGVEVSTDQPSVQVWARGPSQAIRRATPSDFLVRLNVSPVLPQSVESTYALDPANVSAPTSLKIIRLVPADVTVSFDKIVTKAVPISPRFYGQPPTGYHLKEFHLNPSEAWIQGPSRHVERIKAVLTDPIDLSQLVSAKSLVANVNPDDPLVHVMYDQAVTATVAAEKTAHQPRQAAHDARIENEYLESRKVFMSKKLFGTDGIRGVAGEPPLDEATVFAAGLCLGRHLRNQTSQPKVVIGEDTRESSLWIAETVAAGLKEAEVESVAVGVLTTPGVSYLTASEKFTAGLMISASHNPYRDNGIKVFASTGYKLPDDDEKQIEEDIFRTLANPGSPKPYRLPFQRDRLLVTKYVDYLRLIAPAAGNLRGQKLVVDCANGSASAVASDVFSGLGLELKIVSNQPDGRNINLGCGSLFLESLQSVVLHEKASAGVAFDGDADRALFVTGAGRIVDGDGVLLAAARYMKRRGSLRGGAVVGTVMTNLGLEHALQAEGLKLLRTPVGDKYVLDEMLRSGCNLGGEQSGHIIFSDLATTGDGLLTAIEMLRIMADEHRTLDQLVDGLMVFPQTIRNVRVKERLPLELLPQVMEEIRASEERLGSSGRIVVRYSGTELLARVMVEAATHEQVEQNASAIVRAIENSIGNHRMAVQNTD